MFSYKNYHKVKEEIEKRRRDAVALADARAEELRALSPEIKEIDSELSTTGLSIFKAACSGGDVSAIRRRNKELCDRRAGLIRSLGYSDDYSEVKYFCKACSDTGFIAGGKMCSCFREGLIKATIASSGIGDLIENQSFDNFDLEWYADDKSNYERMKEILEKAKNFVKNFKKEKGNLLMVGTTGTGKTHLSTAIAREIINQGYDVIYDTIHNIVSDFEEDKFKSGYSQEEPKSQKYLECDLLIIDDLGTEFSTQFSISCIYNLLNTRINQGKSTVISTNLSSSELSSKYEGRIYSRIIGKSIILPFKGRDHRLPPQQTKTNS